MSRPKTNGPNPGTCILVLGMHRSGTSALGGTLALLGCDPPRSSIGGRADNPKGFFESGRIQQLNDEFLLAAGSSWDDWRPRPAIDVEQMKPAAISALREEFGESRLFVFKDPRNCRLGDLWAKWLRELGCRPVAILPLRSPQEVAASLESRDAMPRPQGVLLWLRHVLEAERASRKLSRIHTTYDALLGDWRGLVSRIATTLDLEWPRPIDEAAAGIAEFLDHDLRHFGEGMEAVESAGEDWAQEVYAILKRWSENGEDRADHKRLDAIRAAFDAGVPMLDTLLRSAGALQRRVNDQAARAEDLHQRLANAEMGWQTTSDQLAAAKQAFDDAAAEAARDRQAADQARAEAQQRLGDSQAELDRAKTEIRTLTARLDVGAQEAATLERTCAGLRRQFDDSQAELLRLQRMSQSEQMLRQEETAHFARRIEEMATQLRELRQRHAGDMDERQSSFDSERLAHKAQLAHERAAFAATTAEIAGLRQGLQQQETLLQRLHETETRLGRLQEELDETASDLRQRRHETEQLHMEMVRQKRETLEARMEAEIVRGRLAALVEAGSRAEADLHRLRGDLAAQEDLLARERIGHKARQARAADEAAQAAARVAALTQQIAEQTTRIAAQEDRLQQLAAVEARLEQERDALKRETAAIRDEASRTQRALEAARDHEATEAAALRNSTSWRITAPLRRMVMLFRG